MYIACHHGGHFIWLESSKNAIDFVCFSNYFENVEVLHTFAEYEDGGGAGRPPPPPIIFEGRNLPQQTLYHWKGNLSKNPIHFRYQQNILISRLYERFSRNDSAMSPEKFHTFKI